MNIQKKIRRNEGMAKIYHANAEFYYDDKINEIRFGNFGYPKKVVESTSVDDYDAKALNNQKLAELNKNLLQKLNELKNIPDKKSKKRRKVREEIIKIRKEIESIEGNKANTEQFSKLNQQTQSPNVQKETTPLNGLNNKELEDKVDRLESLIL